MTVCILPGGYHFPSELAQAVKLSPAGHATLASCSEDVLDLSEGDAAAVALAAFVADDSVLIDTGTTDDVSVMEIVGREIAERRIRYPWVFGRNLDRHYQRQYSGAAPVQALPPVESYALLDGVPQGVSQLRDLVAGPYGVH